MFRRRSPAERESPEQPEVADGADREQSPNGTVRPTGKKGHPTPKRSEAERRRRQPLSAPRDRKEAYRQTKDRQRAERRRARAGLAAGDERFLPPRDKGPARRLARDCVDSRRSVGEFFLYVSIVVIGLALVPSPAVRFYAYYVVWPLLLVAIVVDSMFIARRVRRLARERYPDESTRGLTWYAVSRSLQIRRLRLPPPKVKVGQSI